MICTTLKLGVDYHICISLMYIQYECSGALIVENSLDIFRKNADVIVFSVLLYAAVPK